MSDARTLRGASRVVAALAVACVGAASCAGVQERLDLLRARKIELIDDKEQTKLDVETELRTLRDRVAKLEAELAAAKVTAPAAPSAVVAATPDAGANANAEATARRTSPGTPPTSSGAPRPAKGAF